jgi:5-formyltetrahydrofolate cyclo-ligase
MHRRAFNHVKEKIRKEVLEKRDELSPDVRAAKDSLIRDALFSLPEYLEARTIFFYASFRSEVGTMDMIRTSIGNGKRVVLPKVNSKGHSLMLYEIESAADLAPGYMGIPEPFAPDDRLTGIDDVDLVIMPGAGFDFSGNRLGYGAGYYDILLSGRKNRMPILALAYEEQLVDSIPAEKHDVKVNIIVTDKRVLRII